MNKLIRLYNQNRALVFASIGIIALIIIVIQVLNGIVAEDRKERAENKRNEGNSSTTGESTTISPSNVSVITGNAIQNNQTDEETIKQFVEYCNSGKIEEAYQMLTKECKELIYPSLERFQTGYVNRNFGIKRMYTLQNWYAVKGFHTYSIKYTEDVLASGNTDAKNNRGDYITVANQNGKNYLNISSFVGRAELGKQAKTSNISMTAETIDLYMDYTIITFKIKNETNGVISLDSKTKLDNTYLYDENGVKYVAFLNENAEEELKIRRNMTQTVRIKFNKLYNPESRTLKGIIFQDIVLDVEDNNQTLEEKEKIGCYIAL